MMCVMCIAGATVGSTKAYVGPRTQNTYIGMTRGSGRIRQDKVG